MDDKVKKILELQEQGVPRKEIYKRMEYKKIDYLNRFMKRQGFILDGELYVINTEENSANIVRSEAPVKTSEEANKLRIDQVTTYYGGDVDPIELVCNEKFKEINLKKSPICGYTITVEKGLNKIEDC